MELPRPLLRLAACALAMLTMAAPALAQIAPGQSQPTAEEPAEGKPIVPPGMEDVGVTEHLDGPLPLDATFQDQNGKVVRLGDLFDGKHPVVLTLAYHTCPTVCSMVLSQTVESLKQIPWTIGDQYRAITLSFDPHENLPRTVAKRKQLLEDYGRPGADAGWEFLIGNEANIHAVTDAVGFHYHYVEREQQFAHPTVIVILKPNGQVARYLYGLEYAPNDVRLGLLEASNGRSISTVDKVILYCYHYDPNAGRYVVVATRVMQVGSGLCGLALLTFLAIFWLRERAKARAEHDVKPGGTDSHRPASVH